MSTAQRSHHEAKALMEQVNRSLLDGRLARMRLHYRCGRTAERRVLDERSSEQLVPEAT